MGAFHSADIDYVFGALTPPWGKPDVYEDADRELARAMSDAWVRFARTGDPNGAGLPDWPRYGASTDRHMDFGTVVQAGSGLHAQALDAFDRMFAQMRAADRKGPQTKH